jgi:hypothetical protein
MSLPLRQYHALEIVKKSRQRSDAYIHHAGLSRKSGAHTNGTHAAVFEITNVSRHHRSILILHRVCFLENADAALSLFLPRRVSVGSLSKIRQKL